MVELFARMLAALGYDKLLYNMACEEEANDHYKEAPMKQPVCTDVQDRTGNIIAMDKDKERAIVLATTKRPNETLIGTTMYDDGTEDGFILGPCPF